MDCLDSADLKEENDGTAPVVIVPLQDLAGSFAEICPSYDHANKMFCQVSRRIRLHAS